MDDMTYRRNSRISFEVIRVDPSAVSASFLYEKDGVTEAVTALYNEQGVAYFEFSIAVVGVYRYQVNENFTTGDPNIYPNYSECGDDCDLPTLTICVSLPEDEV